MNDKFVPGKVTHVTEAEARLRAQSKVNRLNMAIRIYEQHVIVMGSMDENDMAESYEHSVKASNYFFNRLEGNTDE
jgi:hypothetical protein